LDKAAIIGEQTSSASPVEIQEDREQLCTVEQVREVSISSLAALQSFISFIVPFLFWAKKARQQSVTQIRIGVGMFCSILSCIAAWQVEVHRIDLSDPNYSISVLWLVPQFSLLGLMDGLASNGLQEFFYNHVAPSMRSYGPPFSDCVLGFGNFISIPLVLLFKSWFKDTIDTSHLDRYYLTLAILNLVCLVMYAYASYSLKPFHMGNASEDEELNEILIHDTDGLTESQPITRSVSFPIRRRHAANAAAATATESQPTKSVSFPSRSISLRLKDKKVGQSAANVDSPEHMEEPLLQSHASTEAEEGLPPDDKPAESHHD
ncbi:hypothetical protein CMV_027828, partial [Castanea mollissima]